MPNSSNPYKIKVDGVEFSPEATPLVAISCDLHIDMMSMAEMTIASSGKETFPGFKMGTVVEITLGGSDATTFKGVVTELRLSLAKGDATMRVIAMDSLVKLYASRESKAYESVTDSDIANSVFGAAGVTGSVDSTSATSDYVIQRNESNLTFVKRLAARNNYHLRSNESTGNIEFKKPQFSGSPVEVAMESVISLEYRMSTIDVPPSVTVMGWDVVKKEKVTGKAESGVVDLIGSGKNVVGDKAQLLWKNASHVSDVQVSTQGGATEMAKAELNRAARNFLRGVVRVSGDATFVPGKLIKITGNDVGFNPTGYIISVRHVVDPNGFMSEVHFISNTYPA